MQTFNERSTGILEGSGGNGHYQGMGVGNNEVSYREVTRKPMHPHDAGPDRSQGEIPGAGSSYTVRLVERPNLSNPRNRGPERSPSLSASRALPIITTEARNTGRMWP